MFLEIENDVLCVEGKLNNNQGRYLSLTIIIGYQVSNNNKRSD